jgi:hypothetical protein
VPHREYSGDHGRAEQSDRGGHLDLLNARDAKTIRQAADGDRQQQKSRNVERGARFAFVVGNHRERERDGRDADGDIDVEDPTPGGGAGDEVAERRTDHGRDEGRPDERREHGAGALPTRSKRRSSDSDAPKRNGMQRRAMTRIMVLAWRREAWCLAASGQEGKNGQK